MFSTRPSTSRLLSRMLNTTLERQADRIVEIAPSTCHLARPAIALPDEADRVIQTLDVSDRDTMPRLNSPYFTQGAAFAYRLRDALIADGSVMTRCSYANFASAKRSWILKGPFERIEEGALCSSSVIEQYFGHWLTDGLSQELLARDRGLMPLTLTPPTQRIHEAGYRTLLGLTSHTVNVARVGRLWIFEDGELSTHRVARIEKMRDRLRRAISGVGPARVYITRGTKGALRSLVNENEVIELLAARGFSILSPEHASSHTIVAQLRSANIVVSVEGSALAHAALAVPRGAGLFVIQPPRRFNLLWKSYCSVLNLNFGYTVADAVGDCGFRQPLDRLSSALDLFEAVC